MIVECESCGTRFNLADAQVPEQGARVRCSKCHHRFYVMPQRPTSEEAAGAGEEEEVAPAGPPPTPGRDSEDHDLDNPEFLFDSEQAQGKAAPRLDDDGGTLGEPETDETLFGMDDEPGEVRREAFGFQGSEELTSDPDEEAAEAAEAESPVVPPDAALPEAPGDDPLASLDSGETSAQIDAWGERDEPARETELARSSQPRANPVPRPPAAAAAPTAAEMDSLGVRMAGGAVRAVAWLVGVALVAGGLNVLASHGMGPARGPESIRAHGWRAFDITARQARYGQGGRVLVVQGSLESVGSGAPPRVRATLLDAQGRELAESESAVLERLDAASVAALLARGPQRWRAPALLAPSPAPGFTVLIPEPPPAARRYRLELLPGDTDS